MTKSIHQHGRDKNKTIEVTRILKNRQNGICALCKNQGYNEGCILGEYGDSPCFANGYNDYWEKSEIVKCSAFETKFIKREETNEASIIANKLLDNGLYAEWSSTGDIESGTYYTYSIIDTNTKIQKDRGCVYNLEKALEKALDII